MNIFKSLKHTFCCAFTNYFYGFCFFKKGAKWFCFLLILSACENRRTPPPLPKIVLPPHRDQAPSPEVHPDDNTKLCFADLTLEDIHKAQVRAGGTSAKPAIADQELKATCAKANTAVQKNLEELVQKLIAMDSIDETKINLIVDKLAQGLDPVLQPFSFSKVDKENVKVQILVNLEQRFYQQAEQALKERFLAQEQVLAHKVSALHQVVLESVQATKPVLVEGTSGEVSLDSQYQAQALDSVQSLLESKYDRRDLSTLQDKGLGLPRSVPYEFKSPEGPFLEKSKVLYKKLWEANPYHEQGIRARNCGLSAMEVADEEQVAGSNLSEHLVELAHAVGEKMMTIVQGALPLGEAREFYAFCTGKDLLTGADKEPFKELFGSEEPKLELLPPGFYILLKIRDKALKKPIPLVFADSKDQTE